MENKRNYYLGIDLNDKYAMISYFQLNMNEPETVSTIAGSENFQIPLILAKRKEIGQWYYGDEARKMAQNTDMICLDKLLSRAVNGDELVIDDETYPAEELLALFLNKITALPNKLGNTSDFDRLVITVDRLSKENMDMFWRIMPKLGLKPEQFMVIDHKESFYYFALSQKEDLWLHDVYLFEFDKTNIRYFSLKRSMRTTPQVVTIEESPKRNINGDPDIEFRSEEHTSELQSRI